MLENILSVDEKYMSWLAPKVILGTGIITIGTMGVLGGLGIHLPGSFVLLVIGLMIGALGLGMLNKREGKKRYGRAWTLLILGDVIILAAIGILGFSIKFLILGGILWFGYRLFREGFSKSKMKDQEGAREFSDVEAEEFPEEGTEEFFKYKSFAKDKKAQPTGQELKNGEVSAVLGECTLDLTQVEIDPLDSTLKLDVFVLGGSLDIIVPSEWKVRVKASTVLGGIEKKLNSTDSLPPELQKTLIIDGSVILGGMEIKTPDFQEETKEAVDGEILDK